LEIASLLQYLTEVVARVGGVWLEANRLAIFPDRAVQIILLLECEAEVVKATGSLCCISRYSMTSFRSASIS
jgi:hypothetical protein